MNKKAANADPKEKTNQKKKLILFISFPLIVLIAVLTFIILSGDSDESTAKNRTQAPTVDSSANSNTTTASDSAAAEQTNPSESEAVDETVLPELEFVEPTIDDGAEDAYRAALSFLEAYIAHDGIACSRLYDGDKSPFEFSPLICALAEQATFQITSAKLEDETHAIINVKLRNVNISEIILNQPESISDTTAASAYLIEALAASSVPMAYYEATIPCTKTEDGWKISTTASLSDALLGGYYSFINSLTKEVEAQ